MVNQYLFTSRDECMESLKYGIATVEGNGMFVKDWRCIAWGESA
jgi:hypothetical protein